MIASGILRLSLLLLTCPLAWPSALSTWRTDGRVNPIGVSKTPTLSWRLESGTRGTRQTRWQILVASSPALLARNQGDLWDSGMVKYDRAEQVVYAGKQPAAGQRCHWKVRCWDDPRDEAQWSESASWETAPLSPDDWHGAGGLATDARSPPATNNSTNRTPLP